MRARLRQTGLSAGRRLTRWIVAAPRRHIPVRRTEGAETAVVVHLYYPERWDAIEARLTCLEAGDYDLFVSLNRRDRGYAQHLLGFHNECTIWTVRNSGRDIAPFLQLLPLLKDAGYRNVLKLHSKKTQHRADGEEWFSDLLAEVLPSGPIVRELLTYLESHVALAGPADHFVSLSRYMGDNGVRLESFLAQLYSPSVARMVSTNLSHYGYFAGTMFWASLQALEPLMRLQFGLRALVERGRKDGTVWHAAERLIGVIAQVDNVDLVGLRRGGLVKLTEHDVITEYKYAEHR